MTGKAKTCPKNWKVFVTPVANPCATTAKKAPIPAKTFLNIEVESVEVV